jgi:polysaccharide deacetylase family protein (PEP-CTERM system associated)
MLNALTIDVEDYFHVTAFEKNIDSSQWDQYPLRVVENTTRILDLLDSRSVKATFFILGWVAERRPRLVQEIHRRGHEIACHGYGHKLVYRIGPDSFRDDIRKSKMLLEDICGTVIKGYRAPSYSITKESLWAFDILIEEGFRYDSSIFPIVHDIYGVPHAQRFPHEISLQSGSLLEFPMSTLEICVAKYKLCIPAAGGGYLRLFPVQFFKKAISRINEKEGQPVVLYFHPWEIDKEQPKINAGLRSTFRHYHNIDKTEERVQRLLGWFNFAQMNAVLGTRYPVLL